MALDGDGEPEITQSEQAKSLSEHPVMSAHPGGLEIRLKKCNSQWSTVINHYRERWSQNE